MDKKTLPLVDFDYPDSETGHMKVRYVRVTEMNSHYVKGFEQVNPTSTDDGKFKKYCLSRIARSGIHLREFKLQD